MKVYIATLPNGFFGSAGQSWKSLDVKKISSLLNYNTEIITINDLVNINFDEKDIVIYTSSDEDNIRLYLRDVIYFVNKKCNVIPSYNLLLSHENKGFQELLKADLNFGNLYGHYFFDIDETKLPIPKVLKEVSGAGGNGVFLVKNKDDILDIKNKYFSVSKRRKLIKLQRRLKLRYHDFEIYSYRYKGFNSFVEQKFIPNLKSDFKILVFGDRYYGVNREIRKNDFRASGSGILNYIEIPEDVLSFAKSVFDTLDNPYLSLDIAYSVNGCHLIEFQGTNFGPIALLNAPSRYRFSNGNWIKEKNNKDLEENFAYALNMFMRINY